jgi:hypothetical protein
VASDAATPNVDPESHRASARVVGYETAIWLARRGVAVDQVQYGLEGQWLCVSSGPVGEQKRQAAPGLGSSLAVDRTSDDPE